MGDFKEGFIIKKFLAIDFGTTQTSVAVLNENSTHAPEVLQINDGQHVVKAIATAMQLDDDSNVIYFGAKALAKAEEAPENTFQNFKAFVGKKDKTYQLRTEQDRYSPDDLALIFFRKLKTEIEEHNFNGLKLSDIPELVCIVGCPADWNDVRKNILKNIAFEAGFPNVKLCDEPIGVIYYNHFYGDLKLKASQKILVYDFGGGTTDVAVAKVELSKDGEIKPDVLSVSGLPDLGGRNFDSAVANYYMEENNYDLKNLSVKDRLQDQWAINLASRGAKEDLSSKSVIEKIINRLKAINGQRPNKLSLSREKFNEICADLIEKFDDPIYDALNLAQLAIEDIDSVILAGGSSSMPYVQEKVRKIFPKRTEIFVSSGADIIAQGLAAYLQAKVLNLKSPKQFDISEDEKNKSCLIDSKLSDTNSKQSTIFFKEVYIAVAIIIGIVSLILLIISYSSPPPPPSPKGFWESIWDLTKSLWPF